MTKQPQRLHRVIRVSERDRDAIRKLTAPPNDQKTRFEALSELINLIPALKFEDDSESKRPIRLALPAELHEAILKAKKKSKQHYVTILLAAIHCKLDQQTKPKRGRPRKKA
jgi:hypothetical protein